MIRKKYNRYLSFNFFFRSDKLNYAIWFAFGLIESWFAVVFKKPPFYWKCDPDQEKKIKQHQIMYQNHIKAFKKKQILLWNDVLSLKKVHTTRKVRYEMFFSLYQIFEDAIYGYTIVLGPDHLDILLLKEI